MHIPFADSVSDHDQTKSLMNAYQWVPACIPQARLAHSSARPALSHTIPMPLIAYVSNSLGK